MRLRRVVIIAATLFSIGFGLYLRSVYIDLKDAFERREQFIPTRIYSDVTRVAPPQLRGVIEDRLKALAYNFNSAEDQVTFNLHPVDYPVYLVPESHPVLTAAEGTITLHFSGPERSAALQSIQLGDREIPDLYLEPEMVTALARNNTNGPAKREIRALVKFNDIPAPVWQAIIAIEDQHFLEHNGLDPRGIARAILVNAKTLSFAQGGSTISMQLVKNLTARRGRNLVKKVNELFLTLMMEASFDKEQILERYLNEVYLGQVGNYEVHGVAEGAEHFFGKELKDLNLAEIALMAGLIRGPGYYSPYRYRERAMERQRLVLKKMVETGIIAEEEGKEALKQPIRLAPPMSVANKAPYFTDYVKAEMIRQLKGKVNEAEIPESGFRVYTTLDMTLNSAAQQSVSDGIDRLEKALKLSGDQRLEGALATVDHGTGFIRALVGGRNYARSTFNRILNMKRQVGSTFKPIVFLAAYQKGKDANGVPFGPGYPIEDAPWSLTYDRGKQKWAPRNYEKKFMDWITLRTALAHSVNTSTARLAMTVGIDSVIQAARAIGIESDLPAVPALALGVAELSPIELLRAYSVFANAGIQDELTVIRAITQEDGSGYARFVYHPKQVLDPAPVELLTDTLTSVFTEGTAHEALKLGFERPAAGKTGTTSNYRDAWFAGYTPQLTTVVWVGTDQEQLKQEKGRKLALTGATSALPIWVQFMKEALAGEPPTPFPVSAHLNNVSIDRKSGQLATQTCPIAQVITEKYIKGNEPRNETCQTSWPASTRDITTP